MVGIGRRGDAHHPSKTVWEDAEYEHAGEFFSVEYAGRAELFEGLAIWDEEIYRELQGTWPVLFASFAGVKETSFPKAKQSICRMIGELYRKYDFLLKGDLLTETERELYQNVSMYMDEVTAASSLQTLGGYLYRYYGKK